MLWLHHWFVLALCAALHANPPGTRSDYWNALQYLAKRTHVVEPFQFSRNMVKKTVSDNYTDERYSTSYRRMLSSDSQCGVRSLSDFKIVGGKKAPKGGWPWLVALGYRDGSGEPSFQCGGALIAPRFVLTAAHCVHERPDLYMVRLGENDLTSVLGADLDVDESVVHAAYKADSNENDIALLKLKGVARMSRLIQSICLPLSEQVPVVNASRVWVAGWGATSYQGPSSPYLMQLSINIMENSMCRKAYERFGESAVVDNRVVCAGVFDTGKDACQGDSGGPLMWEDGDGVYRVIGVISFGYKCAEPNFPGVYTSVPAFLPWIQRQLRLLTS